jgi:hypothetical protein
MMTETKTPPKEDSSSIVDLLLRLPVQYGLMITLSSNPHCDSSNTTNDDNYTKSSPQQQQSYLTLHPQIDANLPRFHPNIYIPQTMLQDDKSLIKYGGGGSGVTVFGGYHPSLQQQLVMKHGGYKDLLELVSLAKIDREIGVRAQFGIDTLAVLNAKVGERGGKSSIAKSSSLAEMSRRRSDDEKSSINKTTKQRSFFQRRTDGCGRSRATQQSNKVYTQ